MKCLYVVPVYFSNMFHLTQYRNIHANIGTQLGLISHINSNLTREDMDIYRMHRVTGSIGAHLRMAADKYTERTYNNVFVNSVKVTHEPISPTSHLFI